VYVLLPDGSKHTGVALEKAYQFTLWLIPTLEKFPRGAEISARGSDRSGGA
jgi:hypothetical protein